ncbi:GNAT family N-acetyltransferase [Octadecabacter sp.]|nr:GNAT family N-acetyltransferase [Octadecabacter sp.]
MTALQQSPAFARALEVYGATIASTAPVVLRRQIAGRLPVTFASRIRPDQLSATRPRIINGETDTPSLYRAAGYRQILTPAHVAEWDLSTDLRAGLHVKWRNQLRKVEKSGLRIRTATWTGTDHPLLHYAAETAKKRRFKLLPARLIATFAQLHPGDAMMFEVYDKGHMIAALLVLRHGTTATLQTAWTSALGRALNAHNLLFFKAATALAQLGHTTFDLGIVETDHAPTLARFKLRTGAALRALGGTWIRLR